MVQQANPWLYCPKPNPDAAVRLFCFPHAAGMSSFYSTWPDGLPTSVEVCAFEISDRERRLNEKDCLSVTAISETIAREIHDLLDRPFAIFGHCIGSLLAFETAHQISNLYGKLPMRLLLASMVGPSLIPQKRDERGYFLQQSPEDLLGFILPEGHEMRSIILADPIFVQSFAPLLMRDVWTLATYDYPKRHPLPCPFDIFGGQNDHLISYDDLLAWEAETMSECSFQIFPGDHLFMHAGKKELLQAVGKYITHEL